MKPPPLSTGQAILWKAPDFANLELFRSSNVNHAYPRHSHPVYSLGAIEAGVGFHRARGAQHFNHPGCVVLLSPEEVHGGAAHGGPCSYRMLYISQADMADCLPPSANLPHFRENILESASWAGQFLRLHQLLETSNDSLERQTAFFSVLTGFLAEHQHLNPPFHSPQEHAAVRAVIDYLYAYSQHNIQIQDLARLTQLHRAYLMRLFLAQTGLTIHAYLTQVRLEQAKAALLAGKSAAEVAQNTGFADQSHLIRLFKRYTGTTPNKYTARSFLFYQNTPKSP
jgi:AraC-like DNA-binding protein